MLKAATFLSRRGSASYGASRFASVPHHVHVHGPFGFVGGFPPHSQNSLQSENGAKLSCLLFTFKKMFTKNEEAKTNHTLSGWSLALVWSTAIGRMSLRMHSEWSLKRHRLLCVHPLVARWPGFCHLLLGRRLGELLFVRKCLTVHNGSRLTSFS